jgi:hypothetical protein
VVCPDSYTTTLAYTHAVEQSKAQAADPGYDTRPRAAAPQEYAGKRAGTLAPASSHLLTAQLGPPSKPQLVSAVDKWVSV